MRKILLLQTLCLIFMAPISAQIIFSQNFSSSTNLADYVSTMPNSGQFSEFSTSPNVSISIFNSQLRMVKSGANASYFFRTPNPEISPEPTLIQFKFDFTVSEQVAATGEIPFYFGPEFASSGTTSTTYHSRFGLGISATSGNFYLKVLDNGSAKSPDFSGKKSITFIANNTGATQTYNAPNATTETIADDTWEIWVGSTKVFNDVAARNPNLTLGSFKFQYNSFLPNATLDFDNFEMKALVSKPLPPPPPPISHNATHPIIWVKNSDKQAILDKINQYTWAQNLFSQYKNRVDPKKASHKLDPSAIINSIPAFPGDKVKHREILTLGFEAALLYWLTDDEDYAKLAADITHHYTSAIAGISGDVNFHVGSDAYLIDSREAYTKPPMIYDFVYNYLIKPGTKVYNKASGTNVTFDFLKAETAFKKLADQVFTRGSINSNHPVLEAPGALFNVLAIDDDATRETYIDKFINGTPKQNGLNWMMNEILSAGVWPEATGYSIGPHRIVLELMEVVDRYKPSLNIFDKNRDILKNAFLFENYRFPNDKEVMRFGDAHRTSLNTEDLLERVLTISDRKSYGDFASKSSEILKAMYANNGGFNPKVSTQSLEWNNPLQLLWNVNVDLVNVTPITYNSSINIDYAGIAMQRNINTSNIVESGLMGYTGGAHYVHSHLSGIDMELYGLGAVLGTGGGDVGAGNNARDGEEFRNYHRIFAGHNTVIVNGTSKGRGAGAWKTDNQLFMNTTTTVAAEPKSLAAPVSNVFSFSDQVLSDEINNAKQERVLSIIRTSDNTGYYFDLFRSKSLGVNNFHDYVYHNVGDEVRIVDNDKSPVPLTAAPNRYTSIPNVYNGSTILFPGWHYFEDVQTSNAITSAVKATIPMTKQGTRYMHILMPGGETREYTACKGPATIEAQMGYNDIKTPIFTVRHLGEAWNKPFVSIFEPSRNEAGSVSSVENVYDGDKIVGAKVISVVNEETITDYIISQDNPSATYTNSEINFSFTGRFGILRLTEGKSSTKTTLYIGEGTTMKYGTNTVTADAEKRGLLSIEKANQTITFDALPDKSVGESDFNPGATASSGLPVTYTSSDENIATIVNGMIHIVGRGTTVITATQAGDEGYNEATPATQPFTVYQPPTVKTKNVEVELDEQGKASITPQLVDDGSISYAGELTFALDKFNFSCSDVGSPVLITLTATDAEGHASIATAQATVIDKMSPVITAPNHFFCYNGENYQVPELIVSDNCGLASINYAIAGATNRSGTGNDASGSFAFGISTITWTVTDIHGNESTATTTVTVNAPFNVTIPDVYVMNPAVDAKNTIYIGYGPGSLLVNAAAEGGEQPYSFKWNTGQLTQAIRVNTTGVFSVTAMDEKGCTAFASIEIKILNVTCGNNKDKVMVCHNGNAICVASDAVQTHLNHGDKLGSCEVLNTSHKQTNFIAELYFEDEIIVYPNPVSSNIKVRIGVLRGNTSIQLFNSVGTLVYAHKMTHQTIDIPVQNLASGIYYLKVENGTQVLTKKIMKP